MAWPGFFVFDGIEIVNASRTEQYAKHAGLQFFRPVYGNQALPLMLDDTYQSPLQDSDTPWADSDHLESYDFYGVYPLDVTGIEDSTVNAQVTESTLDGGNVSRPRRTTRTVVFSAALIGQSDCAVEYGLRWLRTALNGGGCIAQQRRTSSDCGGHTMEYLSCEPAVDLTFSAGTAVSDLIVIDGGTPAAAGAELVDGGHPAGPGFTLVDGGNPTTQPSSTVTVPPVFDFTTCLPEYQRFLHQVTITAGPSITQKMTTSTGQTVWTVEFTAVAADPTEYGGEHPIIVGFLDPTVADPYVGGLPNGGIWDNDGYVTTDPPCPTGYYQPVFDPTCPLLIPPPQVPSIALDCVDFPANYIRRMITIPEQFVPQWNEVVPVITLHCPDVDTRNLRLRFYPDADNDQDPDDLCDFLGSVLFTYLPADATVTFDCLDRVVYVDTPDMGRRRGDSIVVGADGGPLQWPSLSCGYGFVFTVDMPQTQEPPVLDLSLYGRVT